jgi:hypothetical protein
MSLFGGQAPTPEPENARETAIVRISPVLETLRGIDPDVLSPREAQAALYQLKRLLEEEP